MTLRARLASITTVLLAAVLAVAGVVLERVTAADVARSLEARARDRARGGPPEGDDRPAERALDAAGMEGMRDDTPSTAGTPTAPLPLPPAPADPSGELDAPPPPPPPPDDPGRGSDGTDAAGPRAPAPPRIDATRKLPQEADGAAVEIYQFQPGSAPTPGGLVLQFHGTSGEPRVREADARARLTARRPAPVERATIDGTTWYVAMELSPPLDAEGRRIPESPPPPPAGPRGDRRPPAPPQRRLISIAFVDAGPAAKLHREFILLLAGVGLGAVLVGGLLAWALAGRMLRPVATAARAAESVERPTDRLPAPASGDELGRLVQVLNGMLARLEASSERERLFLATASHELRRPLTALLGELELASAAGRSETELRESIRLAQGDGQAMGRLVDDILHHARSQAGAVAPILGDVALAELVASALARARRSVGRAIDVRVEEVPDVELRVDGEWLGRALENLLVNAAVHGGDGVHVVVRAQTDGPLVRVHVDDDGPGVPEEEQATIFDPFGRGDRARTVPGFGLGLAVARDVARAHGGDLTVTSPRPGGDAARPGSRFTLSIARAAPRA